MGLLEPSATQLGHVLEVEALLSRFLCTLVVCAPFSIQRLPSQSAYYSWMDLFLKTILKRTLIFFSAGLLV
jgi:hypothetical protein